MLVGQRTKIKNRIHAALAKYGVAVDGASDLFGVRGRLLLKKRLGELPPETRYATQRLMEELEHLDGHRWTRSAIPGHLMLQAAALVHTLHVP